VRFGAPLSLATSERERQGREGDREQERDREMQREEGELTSGIVIN
jgi:hypothetical protein